MHEAKWKKCNFMVDGDQSDGFPIQLETNPTAESREQHLLGTTLDTQLAFMPHKESRVRKQTKSSMPFPVFRST